MRKLSIALALAALALPGLAHAQAHTARFQLSLEPIASGDIFGVSLPISTNGLTIIAPERGDTITSFGLAGEFGILATSLVEPGVSMNFFLVSPGGNNPTVTNFGFTPFLKLNLWVSQHVNPFFQPFAGFTLLHESDSGTFFDGGMYTGVELLVTNWGFKLFTGFEAQIGTPPGSNTSTHIISIPVRWAFTVYF